MTDRPPLRELPGYLWEMMVDEWTSRTWLGKLLYPIWIVNGLVWLIGMLTIVILVQVGTRLFHTSEPARSGALDIYKDG